MFAHNFPQLIVIILFNSPIIVQLILNMIILIRCDDDFSGYNNTIEPILAKISTISSDTNIQHQKQSLMSNISSLTKQTTFSPFTLKLPSISNRIDMQTKAKTKNANSLAPVLSKKPIIQMAEYPGDIMIGAVFPIHQPESGNHSCGSLQVKHLILFFVYI